MRIDQIFNFKENLISIFTKTQLEEDPNSKYKLLNHNSNFSKLNNLNVLKGFIFLATIAYIVSKSYEKFNNFIIRNSKEVENNKNNVFWYLFVYSNMYPQIYFSIWGFLSSYTILLNFKNNQFIVKNILKDFCIRLRLIPLLSFLVYFYIKIVPYIINGPVSGYFFKESINKCTNNYEWISLLFFYSVFTSSTDQCFPQMWIYQSEMIFFIFSSLLLYIFLIKFKLKKVFLILICIIVTCCTTIKFLVALEYSFNYKDKFADLFFDVSYKANFYYKPYLNFSDYMIGTLFGISYYNFGNAIKTSKQIEVKIHENYFEGVNESLACKPKEDNQFNLLGSKLNFFKYETFIL